MIPIEQVVHLMSTSPEFAAKAQALAMAHLNADGGGQAAPRPKAGAAPSLEAPSLEDLDSQDPAVQARARSRVLELMGGYGL
jgi:hypothetical protein